MPSPRGNLTVSLGPQEVRDAPYVHLCSERSETPDTVVKRTLGSPRASLACPGEPSGKERITFRSTSPGSHGAQGHPRSVGSAQRRFCTETPLNVVYGVATCVNLLQNRKQWQLISATGGPMVLGYARVSKGKEQDTRMQETALRAAGVERLLTERASGGRWDRPELHRLLDQLRPRDVVVVWKLDRLSRSLKDLLHLMERITQAGAGFRSLTEAIDTTTPAGRMLMQMVGSFAEFERAMIRERTQAGLAVARAQGRIGGRRPKLGPQQQAAKRRRQPRGSSMSIRRLSVGSWPCSSRQTPRH